MADLIKDSFDITITFLEEVLGATLGNPDIAQSFFDQAPTEEAKEEEEEVLGQINSEIDKKKTVFPKEAGRPFFWDYQIKGFFKDACGILRQIPGTESSKIKSYQKVIDGTVFIEPRKIFLWLPKGATLGECQRPIRARTLQGERIALLISESAPAGTEIFLKIKIMLQSIKEPIFEWLNYGSFRGLSQWRNSGKGRFKWRIREA